MTRASKPFNKPLLDALKPKHVQYEVFDSETPGLSIRVSPGGAKTFSLLYRYRGRRRRYTLGSYPTLTIREARQLARRALADVAYDNDPAAIRAANKSSREMSYGSVLDRFIDEYAVVKKKTWQQTRRTLSNQFRRWHKLDIRQIEKKSVALRLRAIAKARGEQAARKAFAEIRKFFNWCVEQDILDRSPVYALKIPWSARKRRRVLSDVELCSLWVAAVEMDQPFAHVVQLLILTGQRRSEVAKLRWDDLDLTDALWMQLDNKSQRPHEVPLSNKAVAVLQAVPHVSSEYVFPARSGLPLSAFSKSKKTLDDKSQVYDWCLHDLRRTFRSRMASFGYQSEILERILNHTYGSTLENTYNLYSYRSEKRQALEAWAQHIESLVSIHSSTSSTAFAHCATVESTSTANSAGTLPSDVQLTT